MVHKLGFKGFPQFHTALRDELKATYSGPIEKHENWASEVPESHMLNRFAERTMQNLTQTLSCINLKDFDQAVKLLADHDRHLYLVGGRITRALADYTFTHMQAIRPKVTHMTASSATWPHYVLDMKPNDILVIFDIRRYETNLLHLAQLAAERNIQIVLITDQWSSPVSKVADISFNGWVEIPSAWDSNIATMMILEAIIACVQDQTWPETRDRFKRLDDLFDMTKLFKKFN
jgi:DNA-binding MurR/RpiR family transcriptional regulator